MTFLKRIYLQQLYKVHKKGQQRKNRQHGNSRSRKDAKHGHSVSTSQHQIKEIAIVPYDLEQQRKETREMLDDLTTRDQRMLFAVVTLVHLADSKKELDSDTEALQSIVRKHLCQLAPLSWQQAAGLVTALPLGLRRISALRTLTTEALAVLMPFKVQSESRLLPITFCG